MPTIDISYNDLTKLVGKRIPLEELKERGFRYVKGGVEAATKKGDDVILNVKMEDTNRPDLWSTEGVARVLRGFYGKPGMPSYKTKKGSVVVKVDAKVASVRPYTVCAVVRGLKLTEEALAQSIQLQEKVATTFGSGRRNVAIGIYDLNKIKTPIRYTTFKPTDLRFAPLGFTEKMTLEEILQKHPKGREFGHLLKEAVEFPIFIDSQDNVLSMPPIINSNHTGQVTLDTKDVFIECSGFNRKHLMTALNLVAAAFVDRGGRLETAEVLHGGNKYATPNVEPKTFKLGIKDILDLGGIELSEKTVSQLLAKQQYEAKASKGKISVSYPCYRQDIMHARDVVEDVLVAYGYDSIEPIVPHLPTRGSMLPQERWETKVEDALIGLGMQQILSYTLTNAHNLFDKMAVPRAPVAEIENPQSSSWSCFRNALLPGLLEFFSSNKHVEYPQEIFEIGDVVMLDDESDVGTKDVKMCAAAICDSRATYETLASKLDALMKALGITYVLRRTTHPSFIEGRVAEVIVNNQTIGRIGEIHPAVLQNWDLDKPVVAFGLAVEKLFTS